MITGFPFLIPLLAKGNELVARVDGFARQAREHDEEVVRLKGERVKLRIDGKPLPAGMSDRIHTVSEAHLTALAHRDRFLADLHVAMELITKVRALGSRGDGGSSEPNLPETVGGEVPIVKGRKSTPYELKDAVVQASRHYASLTSPDLESERDGMTAAIAVNNGFIPSWMTLGPAERRRAADALARFFLGEMGAKEVDRLIDGSRRVSPELEDRFRRVCLASTGEEPLRLNRRGPPVVLDARVGAED